MKYLKLFESPDKIKTFGLYYKSKYAYPFIAITNNNIVVNIEIGKPGTMHLQKWVKSLYEDKKIYNYSGRVWTDKKVISFWQYPNRENFNRVINLLENRLNIKIWNNSWQIELFQEKDFDIDVIFPLIPIEDFVEGDNFPEEERQLHLMSAAEKDSLRKIGKDPFKYYKSLGKKTPLAYKQAIYQEALAISKYRPYHKEAIKVGYKERYNDIFQKYKNEYEGDRNAFRIYIPLIREKKKSETQHAVEKILKSELGIDVTNTEVFDYVWGKAKFPGSKNWTGIGKMLGKKPEWAPVLKKFAEDETRTLKGKDADLEVCISRHPYDVVGSDTDRPWINCMTLTHYNRFKKVWQSKGGSVSYLKHDVRQGSLTAYLIKKSDRNLQEPLANIGIKPYLNEKDPKDIVLVPDNRMYGMRHLDFSKTVFAWCDEVNGNKIGFYKIAKDLHMDNFHRTDDMSQTGFLVGDVEEYDYLDDRSFFAKKHLPPEGFKGKFESVTQDFTGWIELAYYAYNETIMVDVYSDGEIFDIYTNKKNSFDFVRWIPGNNRLYVHCAREDYPEMIEFLLGRDGVQREAILYSEKEDDMDEDFYKELETRMENKYEAEAEQMQDVKKYNL